MTPIRTAGLLTAVSLLTVAISAQAQNQQPGKAGRPAPKPVGTPVPSVSKPPAPVAITMAEEPFRLKSVGLTMQLPVGVESQITGTQSQSSAQIMDPDKWLVAIKTPISSNRKATPESIAAEVRDELLASASVPERVLERSGALRDRARGGTKAEVIEDVKAVLVPNARPEEMRPGARFYVRIPGAETSVVRGFTIFMLSPGHFVTFDLTAPEANFGAARPAYETMLASARFTDPALMAATRGAAIEAGTTLVTGLTDKNYQSAIDTINNRWSRLVKPSPTGADADAQEQGYRLVRAWKGQRGQIDPARPPNKWTAADREEAYFVEVEARVLDYDQGRVSRMIDSVGRYYMTPNRKDEGWIIRVAIRDSGARQPAVWREIGVRSGTSMTVNMDGSGESKASRPTVPEEGYINQVEAILLPILLIHAAHPDEQGHAGTYGFYSYQSDAERVRFRSDTLDQPQDRAGAWKLTTTLDEDRGPTVALFNEQADLIRITRPDSTVWEPIAFNRLHDIWRSKGLPLETPKPAPTRK